MLLKGINQILFNDSDKDLIIDSIILKTQKTYAIRFDSNFDGKIDYLFQKENNIGFEVNYINISELILKYICEMGTNRDEAVKFVFDLENTTISLQTNRDTKKV